MSLLPLFLACSDDAHEDGSAPSEPAPFTVSFHADRLGQPEAGVVGLFQPGTIPAEDPDGVFTGVETGDESPVTAGEWRAEFGLNVRSDGGFEGRAFHVDADGDWWIAAPLEFEAVPGETLEHTFELDFLVGGWWECCVDSPAGFVVCGAGDVDLYDGLMDLPGLALVAVRGTAFSGTRTDGSSVVGEFVDSNYADATVESADGALDAWCCRGSGCSSR